MEFSVRVSERDYLDAFTLKRRSGMRVAARAALVAFAGLAWTAVIGALVVQQVRSHDEDAMQQAISLRVNILPAALVLTGFVALVWVVVPWLVRRQFRKNPNLQADFFIALTDAGITQRSSMGSSADTRWNAFKSWRESETILILEFPSNLYLVLPKTGLTEAQRQELRSIVSSKLPQR